MKWFEPKNTNNQGFFKNDGVQYPFNGPYSETTGINREEEYIDSTILNTCLYKQVVPANEQKRLNFNRGIVRAISRLVMPNVMPKLTGYGGYGFGEDGNFYADYYDGSKEEFEELNDKGISNYEDSRRQIIKIDKHGRISAFCLKDGYKSDLYLYSSEKATMKKIDRHTASGLIFATTAWVISKIETGKMTTADKQYPVAATLYGHYTQLLDSIDRGDTDSIAAFLRCVDNDIYAIFKFSNYIEKVYGANALNLGFYEIDEIPSLKETKFPTMEYFKGDSSILGGSKVLSKTGGYVDESLIINTKTVKELLTKPEKYLLNPTRQLTDEEKALIPNCDELVPNKKTLDLIKYIKSSTFLPKPFRNVLITGETGSGKTSACRIIAQMMNIPYTFINFSANVDEWRITESCMPNSHKVTIDDLCEMSQSMPTFTEIALDPVSSYKALTGEEKKDATESDCLKAQIEKYFSELNKAGEFMYVESPLVQAFKNGWICELQEINTISKPAVLSGLNASLDDIQQIQLPSGEVVHRHPDCIIIATANVGYEGTRNINQAFLSRCQLKVRMNLPERENLIEMVKLGSGYKNEKNINKMIEVMNSIRRVLSDNGDTSGSCGVREITDWAIATQCNIANGQKDDPVESAEFSILNSSTLDDEVMPSVLEALHTQFI